MPTTIHTKTTKMKNTIPWTTTPSTMHPTHTTTSNLTKKEHQTSTINHTQKPTPCPRQHRLQSINQLNLPFPYKELLKPRPPSRPIQSPKPSPPPPPNPHPKHSPTPAISSSTSATPPQNNNPTLPAQPKNGIVDSTPCGPTHHLPLLQSEYIKSSTALRPRQTRPLTFLSPPNHCSPPPSLNRNRETPSPQKRTSTAHTLLSPGQNPGAMAYGKNFIWEDIRALRRRM